jgi:hypothetical protein
LYNSATHDHFYTTNYSEAQTAANAGFSLEGTMGELETTQTFNNAALFRLFSPSLNNHFYTASAEEMTLATQRGFLSEGVLGYLSNAATTVQVYRMYQPTNGDYFYTTSSDERDLASTYGYQQENILGYLFPPMNSLPPGTAVLPNGVWGGQHLRMDVKDNGVTLEFDCAHGTITKAVTLDQNGNFSTTGQYTQEHGGPAVQGEVLPVHPASYRGTISGNAMSVTVILTDTNQNIGTFSLAFGQGGQVYKCV